METECKQKNISLSAQIQELLFSFKAFEDNPLSEDYLAEHFGVSRTPIRDALKELELNGVIERRQKKGIYLIQPSFTELSEFYDVRATLEGFAGRLLAEKCSDADIEELDRIAKQFTQARKNGDNKLCETSNLSFHSKIVILSGNSLLEKIIDRFKVIHKSFFLTHPLCIDEPQEDTPYPHEEVVERIRVHDADGCERLLRLHILRAKHMLIENMHASQNYSVTGEDNV